METRDVIETLKDLIATAKDGESCFRTCAVGVRNPGLRSSLDAVAGRCAEGAAELQATVRALGGNPDRSGSATGSFHLAWINLKSSVVGLDDRDALAECEKGEDVAEKIYQIALAKDLPADIRSMVERQLRGVKANHDRVRDLRNTAAQG
jgi:uncharacterized protein (TIGR02284 family)